MEHWSAGDERPYFTRPKSPPARPEFLIAFVLVGAAVAGYYGYDYWQQKEERAAPSVAIAPPTGAASEAPEPAIRHPVDPTRIETASLPTLENSDAMMREALAGMLGRMPFDEMVYPVLLIRRIVATVDNLPRETAPRRVMPFQPVPGAFVTASSGDDVSIGPANSARYAPYVRVTEMLESRALVRRYVASYPLFQQAYEELGFPNRHFNDRLVEAIDDLLAAPDVAIPVNVVQPKILYELADPDLESRSAGQKIMIRMGSENAAKVKAKLREIRRELTAAAEAAR